MNWLVKPIADDRPDVQKAMCGLAMVGGGIVACFGTQKLCSSLCLAECNLCIVYIEDCE